MWKIKACPRCQGDLFADYDEAGMFDHCLQCGYIGTPDLYCLVTSKPEQGKFSHQVSSN